MEHDCGTDDDLGDARNLTRAILDLARAVPKLSPVQTFAFGELQFVAMTGTLQPRGAGIHAGIRNCRVALVELCGQNLRTRATTEHITYALFLLCQLSEKRHLSGATTLRDASYLP